MKIYIVRHGETIWNKEGKMQGQLDSDLSEEGIMQAEKLSLRLKDLEFEKIYSSNSGRAIKTAKILIANKDQEIIKSDLIKEIHMGIWQGMDKKDVLEKYQKNNYNFWNEPDKYDFSKIQGESFESLKERTNRFMESLIENHKTGNILVVSHGVTIKAIMNNVEKKKIKDFWKGSFILNTSLSILSINEKKYEIDLISDVSHL